MFPEDERRALERIEAELSAADPALARRFCRAPGKWRWFFVLLAVTGMCALVVGILVGSGSLTVAGIVTIGVLAIEYFSRRPRTPHR